MLLLGISSRRKRASVFRSAKDYNGSRDGCCVAEVFLSHSVKEEEKNKEGKKTENPITVVDIVE